MAQCLKPQLLFLIMSLAICSFGQAQDFTPHGTQPGLQFGLEGVSQCKICHSGFPGSPSYTSDEKNMPYSTWAGSMKAQAARDPLFWAALDVANNDMPGVGDFCLRCHAPQGWLNGHVVKPNIEGGQLLDGSNGCQLLGDHVQRGEANNDYSGVTCHFCHRIDENGAQGEPQIIGNSDSWIDDQMCEGGSEPCRKGPYAYPENGSHNAPPHEWEYSSFIQKGSFCGSCHDVTSPEIMQNGVLTIAKKLFHNGVETDIAMPIERTYSEWKNSLFSDLIYRDEFEFVVNSQVPFLKHGETCQDCHMPNTNDLEARSCVNNAQGDRSGNLKTHQFAGGNTWIPQVLKYVYGSELEQVDEGIEDLFDLSTSYALDMLQTKSAAMSIAPVSNDGTTAVVDVKVTNLTGHKLPTGYAEGRRMWLHVIATDASQNVMFESGAYDLSTAELSDDGQLKVYESQQGIWNEQAGVCEIMDGANKKMFHFVLNNCILKDNRIPPLGFRGGDNVELMPRGEIYSIDPNTNNMVNYDVTRYTFNSSNAVLPINITATLKYQTATKEYIDFLESQAIDNNIQSENLTCDRSWTVGPANQSRGAFMKSLWDNTGKSAPVDMNVKQVSISIDPN